MGEQRKTRQSLGNRAQGCGFASAVTGLHWWTPLEASRPQGYQHFRGGHDPCPSTPALCLTSPFREDPDRCIQIKAARPRRVPEFVGWIPQVGVVAARWCCGTRRRARPTRTIATDSEAGDLDNENHIAGKCDSAWGRQLLNGRPRASWCMKEGTTLIFAGSRDSQHNVPAGTVWKNLGSHHQPGSVGLSQGPAAAG